MDSIKKKGSHIRAYQEDINIIHDLTRRRETTRNCLHRIILDYKTKGVPRKIKEDIGIIKGTCINYLHDDFVNPFNNIEWILLRVCEEKDMFLRSEIADLLNDLLVNFIDELCNNKIIEKTDIKKTSVFD